jgi:methyl-accepting chemotaxis protein
MDKVTQQNAANAEESASASEEMSAQAEQMKGFVTDLAHLVGGNTGPRVQSTAGAVPAAAVTLAGGCRSSNIVQRHTKPGADLRAVEVHKEQLIPLDDSELNNF